MSNRKGRKPEFTAVGVKLVNAILNGDEDAVTEFINWNGGPDNKPLPQYMSGPELAPLWEARDDLSPELVEFIAPWCNEDGVRAKQNSVEAKRRIAEAGGSRVVRTGVEGLLSDLEFCWLYLKTSSDPVAQELRRLIEGTVGKERIESWQERLGEAENGSGNGKLATWAEAGWSHERQLLGEGLMGRLAVRANARGEKFAWPAWVNEAPPQPGATV